MIRVHVADGSPLALDARERRLDLPIQAMPKAVAFLSVQDMSFGKHAVVDPTGIVRDAPLTEVG
ncbi:hypothetical protein [Methylobacterium radiodurans]